MTTETLLELTEIVLKNNIFQFNEKTLKQLRGTAICIKCALPYAIIFMADLEERILEEIELQPCFPQSCSKKTIICLFGV